MSLIVFACIFGGALVGMALRWVLPAHHLSSESKDVVKLGTGLIGTMAALVLGILVGSAKSSYDVQKSEIIEMSANVVLLDKIMSHIGPEADEARATLRKAIPIAIERLWGNAASPSAPGSIKPQAGDLLYDQLHGLQPKSDAQKASISEAQSVCGNLFKTRMMLFAQAGSAVAFPLLAVMVFWLSIVFASFGLFAPSNATVLATLFASAISVSGAIFLILEMDRPFRGVIQISSAPLQHALEQIGK